MIYLDAAATTPVRREVLEAMRPYLTSEFGNPSSQHDLGAAAARALADARSRIAAVLACRASEIIFTSGGTEADNLSIKGIALASPRGRHIVTTPIEHEAVLESCAYLARHHGFEITSVPVDRAARLDPEAFAHALRADTTLCSVILANNEVGTIQPIAELAQFARHRGVPFHTDAVQAAGSLPIAIPALGVDALSLSGHKVGAPKGVGMLFLRGRIPLEPLLHGGGQERGRRSGTENVAAIVGFATALELAYARLAESSTRLTALRDALIQGILQAIPEAILTGHSTERLPNNASFCFPSVSGESLLLGLEERGILCSSGSACAAGRDDPSHVLLAMGYPAEVARTSIRLSLTDSITPEQIATVVSALRETIAAVSRRPA